MDYSYSDYSTTNYGAQGGANGGGFMAGGGSQGNSANRSGGWAKDTLRPVTIKQLVDANQDNSDAEFMIDGTEISQVKFVGQIRNISRQATNVTYRLDDGTGTIEAKVWIDAEESNEFDDPKTKVTENGYAMVFGRLKAFNGKKHVGAHVVRPITDYNAVSHHLLEATCVHLYFTRGEPASGADGAGAGANGNGYEQHNGGYGGEMQNGGGTGSALAGASARARKVYTCIHTTGQSNEGLHMQDIAARLGMELIEVEKAGDELVSLGVIYTTCDDHTWAVLDL